MWGRENEKERKRNRENDNCGGPDKLCHYIDGHCIDGCVSGFQGDQCDQTLAESRASVGSGSDSSGRMLTIISTVLVVAVVAAVTGLIVWRRRKVSRELPQCSVVIYNETSDSIKLIPDPQDRDINTEENPGQAVTN
ncbi:hypothetical protein RRG08_000541 [Elysia crispata]|uniref:EGF-like domain-containing protein n=1 Tax=Elysia crispata TaxID=231223 RepID=A0AAE0Z360_9GAST|nr:hypothetical protein RRG08_000541 [Elysia crispata]